MEDPTRILVTFFATIALITVTITAVKCAEIVSKDNARREALAAIMLKDGADANEISCLVWNNYAACQAILEAR